jgi:hypothetical protein
VAAIKEFNWAFLIRHAPEEQAFTSHTAQLHHYPWLRQALNQNPPVLHSGSGKFRAAQQKRIASHLLSG